MLQDIFFDMNSLGTTSSNGVGYDDSTRTRLLAQASADDLKRAQNPGYTSLYEYIRLQGQTVGKE